MICAVCWCDHAEGAVIMDETCSFCEDEMCTECGDCATCDCECWLDDEEEDQD